MNTSINRPDFVLHVAPFWQMSANFWDLQTLSHSSFVVLNETVSSSPAALDAVAVFNDSNAFASEVKLKKLDNVIAKLL